MKRSFRRHRNIQPKEKNERPFFGAKQNNSKQPFFQAKGIKIAQPGDKYEKEADSMADAVVNNQSTPGIQQKEISAIQRESLSTPLEDERLGTAEQRMEEDKLIQEKPDLQREAEEEEEMPLQAKKEEEEPLQKKEDQEEELNLQKDSASESSTATGSVSNYIKSTAGQGQQLPPQKRMEMEAKFRYSFKDVNIHNDSSAHEMNKELGARAFTTKNDIYFRNGQFDLSSKEGNRLLAHELTHVVQQNSDKGKPEIQRDLYRWQRIISGSKGLGPGISLRWTGNRMTITANMEISGPEATADIASQIESNINSFWNASFADGYEVVCNADVSYRDEDASESEGRTQIYIDDLTGPSNVRRSWVIGSRYMSYDINADINWTPAHEFGHLLGLDDRYSEGLLSKISGRLGGDRETTVEPGWEGNIMAVHGGALESKNIQDLFSLHAYELVTFVEDLVDQANREFNRVEDWLKQGGNPFS